MKKTLISVLAAGGAILLVGGCSTHDKGPYLPEGVKTPAYEGREPVVLLDPGVQYSVTCVSLQEKTLPDGRLEVIAHLRNRENRRIEVQANCVFKDQNGFSTDDESPFWQLVDRVAQIRSLTDRELRLVSDILEVVARHAGRGRHAV